VDDAKANLDILVEGLKPDHKLSLALNGEITTKIEYCPKVLLTNEFLRNTMGAHLNERSPTHEKIWFNHLHPQFGICLPDLQRLHW
jgi:hypothetical protein